MSTKNLSVTDIVKTRCSFCDGIREHVVIAIVDEDTVHIQCTACDSAQDFEKTVSKRPVARPAAEKKPKPPVRGKTDPAIAENKQWVQLRPTMNVDQAVAYRMDGKYQAKALLLHSAFGLGLVMRVAGPHKMEVLFESGKKLLRCH